MRETMTSWAIAGYSFVLPFAELATAIFLFVLLPLSLIRRTRGVASIGIYAASYVIGLAAWLLGAALTFASFGLVVLIIGLMFLGVGVVPLGVIGAYFKLDESGMALNLIILVAMALGMRFVAAYLIIKVDAASSKAR